MGGRWMGDDVQGGVVSGGVGWAEVGPLGG